ncbi:LuxR family transcriptional regulator [Micromonospora zingiberis]|uniref:LuxR family transcriptional regulator n=1 Tax=Micromonospora zingiberis TaxID=2053011 RepID=A0A4R0GP89_9ACTN|nr:LuxR family transcriptional regulator [Micromonospora zingiberis]TCB97298.1 LuxR family transcriptional regulator [Micromonospora zingiberis]
MRTAAGYRGPLVGRDVEIKVLDELIQGARSGRGGALVVRGEAGIGKSTLLAHARDTASGSRVIQASGAEFERELPYGALHQLCVPVLDHLADLPTRHADALRVAFGLAAGTPDLFHIGVATLGLLVAAARERPLLCVIDDAHWLDAASSKALAFVGRRVAAEPITMLFALRMPASDELHELPSLDITGLSDADARTLIAAHRHLLLDEQVLSRLLAEARGNPLALLELPQAGGFGPPDTSPVPTRIERSFRARLSDLPDEARLLLTVASADPTGDPTLVWPAVRLLDIDVSTASASAAATGLVEFATGIRFCHPLARSAVYRGASAHERQRAHRALAEATNAVTDPDRRAWHRAQASVGPDDGVAAELVRSATRAQARGGVVAAAAFLERAAELSRDPAGRIERTLAAAQATLAAGRPDRAATLVRAVEHTALDEFQLAHADLLRGQVAFQSHQDKNGPEFMIRAGRRLAGLDPERARRCFQDAIEMSLLVGRASGVLDLVLAAVRSVPVTASRPPDVLDALHLLQTAGHRSAIPLIRQVLDGPDGPDGPRWTEYPALALMLAAEIWDPLRYSTIVEWLVRTGRESGSPLLLRLGLAQTGSYGALTADLGLAMASIAEEEAIADAIGGPPMPYHRIHLAAMRGRRAEALTLFESATDAATTSSSGLLLGNIDWASAVLHNGLADYPAALAAARRAVADGTLFLASFSLPELVEAAVRCGDIDAAAAALESLVDRADASGTATGLGIAAYARALVTGAEEQYRTAVAHLERSPLLAYRARAHLVYGEWLRREGRRRDCRPHLRTAHRLLSEAGFDAFARRAAVELRATGERPRQRSPHTYDQLTIQELHIARLVAAGATSSEVAAQLFISPRTVDTHLRNIYRKLGINSRRELRHRPDLVRESTSPAADRSSDSWDRSFQRGS